MSSRRVTTQRLQMWPRPGTNPDPNRILSLTYPGDQAGNPAGIDTYNYDAMGRLSNYGATWNPDGTLATFDNGQTRTSTFCVA
jgi:hypothetical protein